MASFTRFSRYGKIAAATALGGGSFYLFRDSVLPYLKIPKHQQIPQEKSKSEQQQQLTIDHKSKIIDNLPNHVPYLLVGGGTASHSAMRAIRGEDPKAKVLIVSSEDNGPYMRPALSKELWFSEQNLRRDLKFKWWNGKERSIFYEIDEFFIPIDKLQARETGGVSLLKNIRLISLDPDNKVAHLENGQSVKYDKCLIAPGGKPKTLEALRAASKEVNDRVIYFRSADDFLRLEEVSESAKSIAIIGGGFLGTELACALTKRLATDKVPENQVIHQIYPETGNLGKVFPKYLSDWISKKLEKDGTHLVPNSEVKSVTMTSDQTLKIELLNGDKIQADYIVCAVGLEPDIELAKSSGLEVDERTGGYLVNSELEARTNVWVAGDASSFYDIKLGRRRVEHHDHAIHSGRQAGQNMVGAGKAYTHQSMFWSDLGTEISFEAVGIIDSSLETVGVFPKQEKENDTEDKSDLYDRGVVFYLKNNIIVGVLFMNMFSRLKIARRILNEQKEYEDLNEVAKLFNLYLDD